MAAAPRLPAEHPAAQRVEHERGAARGELGVGELAAGADDRLVLLDGGEDLVGPLLRLDLVPARGVHVAAVDLLGGVEHVGVDAGRDHVQRAHAGAVELAPERLGQRDHAGLRGGVGAGGGEVRVAADRGVVDDRAAAALEHARQQAAGQVRDADEVDLEHRVHRVHVLLLEQPAGHLAGVVDQEVDRLVDRRGARVDRLAAREVHADRADALDRLERVGVAHAGEHELHRAGGERLREGAADAAVGAGDERGGAGEVHTWSTRWARRHAPRRESSNRACWCARPTPTQPPFAGSLTRPAPAGRTLGRCFAPPPSRSSACASPMAWR